jgi:glycosyltransferase involved in cell wall biosynthesis
MNLFPLLRWQVGLLAWLIHHRAEYDLIHACDFDTILPALICKYLFGKRVVYDIFDFYADHLRATPEWVKRLIRAVDLRAIERADAVILVDDARRAQIAGARAKRLAVVYNSPEDQDVREKQDNVSGEFALRLAYVGLLQVERGLMDVLRVLRSHPEWGLDLAGFGGDEAQILGFARSLQNVSWHGRVSYQTALALSAKADVLFALYDPQIPNHRYASPNKLFEAMMLGKPVVVARGTNMDCIAEEVGFGLLVKYGDIPALESALQQLAQDPSLRAALGRQARQGYDQAYGWHIMEQRLIDLYDEIQSQ